MEVYLRHPGASRVDNLHFLLVKDLHLLDGGTESWQDNDVTILYNREVLPLLADSQLRDAHVRQPLIAKQISDQNCAIEHPVGMAD